MIDREHIKKENAAHRALVAAGYIPQGINRRGKCSVGKIPDGHSKRDVLDFLEFNSWQEAVDYLINKKSEARAYENRN